MVTQQHCNGNVVRNGDSNTKGQLQVVCKKVVESVNGENEGRFFTKDGSNHNEMTKNRSPINEECHVATQQHCNGNVVRNRNGNTKGQQDNYNCEGSVKKVVECVNS